MSEILEVQTQISQNHDGWCDLFLVADGKRVARKFTPANRRALRKAAIEMMRARVG